MTDSDAGRPAGTGASAPEVPPGVGAYEDPIVAEVRAIREAQFAAAGYDLAEYVRRLRAQEATSGHPVIVGRPRPAHDSAA